MLLYTCIEVCGGLFNGLFEYIAKFDVRRLNCIEIVLAESKSRRFVVADVWGGNLQHSLPLFQVVGVLHDRQDIWIWILDPKRAKQSKLSSDLLVVDFIIVRVLECSDFGYIDMTEYTRVRYHCNHSNKSIYASHNIEDKEHGYW